MEYVNTVHGIHFHFSTSPQAGIVVAKYLTHSPFHVSKYSDLSSIGCNVLVSRIWQIPEKKTFKDRHIVNKIAK